MLKFVKVSVFIAAPWQQILTAELRIGIVIAMTDSILASVQQYKTEAFPGS